MGERATGYIQAIRNPMVFFNHLTEKVKPYYDNSIANNEMEKDDAQIFFSYLSRRDNWDKLLSQISLLREDLCAAFGENSIFTSFYDLIIASDIQIYHAFQEYLQLKREGNIEQHAVRIQELRQIMFEIVPNDEISKKINNQLELLKRERGKL